MLKKGLDGYNLQHRAGKIMQRIIRNIKPNAYTTGHDVMFIARYDCLIQINAAVTILDVYKLRTTQVSIST